MPQTTIMTFILGIKSNLDIIQCSQEIKAPLVHNQGPNLTKQPNMQKRYIHYI